MRKHKQAFTLVELIVVITILAILWTVGYISLIWYNLVARDTVRLSDINNITKVIELYKLENGNYPTVSNSINITFSGANIWQQWMFWKESQVDARRISQIPIDPLTGTEYPYSLTYATWEYQVGTILEKSSSLSYIPQDIFS